MERSDVGLHDSFSFLLPNLSLSSKNAITRRASSWLLLFTRLEYSRVLVSSPSLTQKTEGTHEGQ